MKAFEWNDSTDHHDYKIINEPPSDPVMIDKDNGKVSDYLGHFIVGDKYVECCYVVYGSPEGTISSSYRPDKTCQNIKRDML